MKQKTRTIMLAAMLAFAASGALAHGDEDHSQDAKKAPATAAASNR